MLIYHGSQNIIPVPTYGYGKATNDYGRGFYCTESLDLACEWSVDIAADGYANCYEIDISRLNVLDLNSEQYGVLEWMAILLKYRDLDIQFPIQNTAKQYLIDNFYINVDSYDVVRGYRADDSFFSFARAFLSNTISYRQLREALHLGDLGEQIVLKSKLAYDSIDSKGYVSVDSTIWYPKKQSRDFLARRKFFDMISNPIEKGELYINNIITEEIKQNDERLR